MVGGRPVGGGDVGARQQEPGEIDTGAAISDDDWSGGRGLARVPQARENALASSFCAAHRRGQEASRPVQDPDLASLRLCNP